MKEILREREPGANMMACVILCCFAGLYLLLFFMFRLSYARDINLLADILFPAECLITLFSALICYARQGKDRWIKYMVMIVLMVCIFGVNILTANKTRIFYVLPIILSCRYFNRRFTGIMTVFSIFGDIANAFTNAYLATIVGCMDLNMVAYEQPVTMTVTGSLSDAIDYSLLNPSYVVAHAFQMITLPNILTLLLVGLACEMIIDFCQSIMLEVNEMHRAKAELEIEMKESRTRIMLSQIQPHFLYNALSAIMSIEGNPDETVDAIGEFGKYLRENMNVLTADNLIPFTSEMQHVMRYVSLEKLRFGDRVQVVCDLQTENFRIPPLSAQMIVENAIKHGVSKKPEGGTVHLQTSENEEEYLITVTDDGIGFDTGDRIDTKKHIGLSSVGNRLKTYCNGSFEISSIPGRGTTAVMHIPKEKNI